MAFSENKSTGLIFVVILIAMILLGAFFWQNRKIENVQKNAEKAQAIKKTEESELVQASQYQAIFLSSGQVYFGKISKLHQEYLVLTDIYYVNSNAPPLMQLFFGNNLRDVTLIKLGCELHGPEDMMIINRDKVDFWENLQDKGETVKAIKTYQESHPKGETCPAPALENDIKINPSVEI